MCIRNRRIEISTHTDMHAPNGMHTHKMHNIRFPQQICQVPTGFRRKSTKSKGTPRSKVRRTIVYTSSVFKVNE